MRFFAKVESFMEVPIHPSYLNAVVSYVVVFRGLIAYHPSLAGLCMEDGLRSCSGLLLGVLAMRD